MKLTRFLTSLRRIEDEKMSLSQFERPLQARVTLDITRFEFKSVPDFTII